MRQILFKAKRIDNGVWVEGLVSHPSVTDTEKGVQSYYFNAIDEFGFYSQCIVSADTICQYTGLTDKNGNKIWENDIVCTPYVDPIFGHMVNDIILMDYTWKLLFYDGGFCVENENKRINLRSFTNGNHIEVIGNIFDNPELLGED